MSCRRRSGTSIVSASRFDVNLHEHMETAVNSVQKRETGNKKYLWVHGLLPNGDPHCTKADALVLLCGPDALLASTGERIGEAKSEEIFDYLIHVLKEKGLRKGPWIHLPQTQEQKDEDKRMSPS